MRKGTAAKFKKTYDKAKTWGEADALAQTLTAKDQHELFEALKVVKAYMGLDMRQDCYMTILRHSRV